MMPIRGLPTEPWPEGMHCAVHHRDHCWFMCASGTAGDGSGIGPPMWTRRLDDVHFFTTLEAATRSMDEFGEDVDLLTFIPIQPRTPS